MIHLRIAMLGDDRSQIFALRSCLLTAGYVAQRYETAADFLCAVSTAGFDTLILGSSVKDLTGLEVLARVRSELNLTAPVIMVTSSKREDYIVKVLRGGADECITTPVGDREFLARLEAVTRRWVNAPPSVRSFQVGRLTVNIEARRILLDKRPVELTIKDYDLAVLVSLRMNCQLTGESYGTARRVEHHRKCARNHHATFPPWVWYAVAAPASRLHLRRERVTAP